MKSWHWSWFKRLKNWRENSSPKWYVLCINRSLHISSCVVRCDKMCRIPTFHEPQTYKFSVFTNLCCWFSQFLLFITDIFHFADLQVGTIRERPPLLLLCPHCRGHQFGVESLHSLAWPAKWHASSFRKNKATKREQGEWELCFLFGVNRVFAARKAQHPRFGCPLPPLHGDEVIMWMRAELYLFAV